MWLCTFDAVHKTNKTIVACHAIWFKNKNKNNTHYIFSLISSKDYIQVSRKKKEHRE